MKVLAFGEILWDVIEGSAHLGGAPLNFAAHAAQCGAASYMISRLGKDRFGENAFSKLKEIDVESCLVQIDREHPTGTVDVFLADGQPSYTIHPYVAYDYISFEELTGTFHNTQFDIFYFGTLAQRSETSRNTLYQILETKTFSKRFYDVNFRKDCYSKETVLESLKYSDILKLNDEEVATISVYLFSSIYAINDFMKACYEKYGNDVIIITAGDQGCYVHHDNAIKHVPGRKVIVKDTIGAGDSFSASFMYKYFHTGDPIKAASVANQIGGFVASHRGAIPPYTVEIYDLLNE